MRYYLFHNSQIYTLSLIRLLALCGVLPALCVWTAGCSESKFSPPSPAPTFTAPPAIVLDPNLNTPLAAELHVTTNIPTKINLDIKTNEKSWSVAFNDYHTEHTLAVLGLYADLSHEITVHASSQDGQHATFPEPLQVVTEPLPDGFPSINVLHSDPAKMEPGLTLFDIIPEGNNAEFGALIVIVDELGSVVWYQIGSRFTNVRQTGDGTLLYLQGSEYVEMDMLGNPVRKWKAVGKSTEKVGDISVATASFHHEVYPMNNGNFLTLSIETRAYDNYPTNAWKPNSLKTKATVAGDLIVEFAPDGSIVNEWSLLERLDPYRVGYDSLGKYWNSFFGKKTLDWSHSNSVIHDPRDDSVIVSSRHQDAVVKFNRKTGKIIWILGTHDNWDKEKFGRYLLKPLNDQQYFFPFHQHSPMILPNGNLMLYDNGNYRASPFDKPLDYRSNFSRAVEYAIDEKNMTIELVWEYGQTAREKVYSAALGDANYLPETGNVLITHGNIYEKKQGKKLSAQILEVTHTTPVEEVFNMVVYDDTPDTSNGWRVYRSKRIRSLYPQ